MFIARRIGIKGQASIYWGFLCFLTCLSIAIFLFTSPTYAAQTVPYKLNYQGRLTDASGAAKPDGQYNMTFRLYSVASGGSAVWTEVRETTNRVTVTDGRFAVQLGDVTALTPSLFTSQPLYFEIELPTPASATCSTASCAVYAEGAMTPRQTMASSAYAMNADTIDGSDATSFVIAAQNNTHTGTNLLKNTTNSTAAFGVQNAAGTSLLNVDTTNSAVALGTDGTNPAMTILNTGRVGIGTANPSVALEVAGNALFRGMSTSATTFQVQNSSAINLFTVDTLNNYVRIGAEAADGVGTVLVLDTKNTAGDPTGTDGAMYYNSNLAKMRCYEAGVWGNCIANNENILTVSSTVVNNNSTANTLADIPALSFSVTAGTRYNFSAMIHYTAAATTTGSRWTVNGPATSFLSYNSRYTLTATSETSNFVSAYSLPAASNASSINSGNIATIEGMVTPSANGTVVIRFASEVANSAITVQPGSTLRWW